MDEILIMVLCAALAGVIIGSSGTIVTFWCCGTLDRRAGIGRINPELENQGTSGETPGSIQMRRTQTFSVNDPVASSFRLHVGNAGTRCHIDSLCECYPDNVKRELSSICEVCRNSSTTFEIGQGIFVSERGQKFHLTRYCRTFKNLRVTEYLKCTACVHLEILCEIQYFVSEELLLRLQIRQDICLRLLQKPVSFCLKWDGTPCTFLECIWTALRPGQRFPF